MFGITQPGGVYVFGRQKVPNAKASMSGGVDPSKYNASYIQTQNKTEVPVPVGGVSPLPLRWSSKFGHIASASYLNPIPEASSYNTGMLKSFNTRKAPVPHPRVEKEVIEQVRAQTDEGEVEGDEVDPSATVISTSDIKDIAATFPENSKERNQWLDYLNSLTRLDVAEKLGEVTDLMRQKRTTIENKIREALEPGSPLKPTMLSAPVATPGAPSGTPSGSSSSVYKIGDPLPTSKGSIQSVQKGTLSNDEWKKLGPSLQNQYIQHLRDRAIGNKTMRAALTVKKEQFFLSKNAKNGNNVLVQTETALRSLNTKNNIDIVITKKHTKLVKQSTSGDVNYTVYA